MGRLDDYRTAILAAEPAVPNAVLIRALDAAPADFDVFVIDHGLGPLWHARTKRNEFRESRLVAEARFLAQERALVEIDAALADWKIDYAVIKGAATRLAVYDNPALRACHDIDLLVRYEDRLSAASALLEIGFEAQPLARSISRELVLSREDADIDLHWGLLRDGRLRDEDVHGMLGRNRRVGNVWMLSPEDATFLLLVHPAFAKHLAGWDMGLHRVVDIMFGLRHLSFDWPTARQRFEDNGVMAAAWTTLRWTRILTQPRELPHLDTMMSDLEPGTLRARWLDFWLQQNLSNRLSGRHWARLLGLTTFLHDSPGDALRALAGRYRARRHSEIDLAAFRDLTT